MKMSYRRAWLLVDDLNRIFRSPLVEAQPGGAKGGGAHLTPSGEELIRAYDALEQRLNREASAELDAIRKLAG